MGVVQKPTNNASQTSKFAVFITVMILLLCCGGLVRIELILNDRVEHLEAQIQSIEADTNRSAKIVDPESLTVFNSEEHHNQNSSSFVQEQKKQDKSKEDNKVCGHGECILEETNKEYDEVHSNARRTRRALSLSLLLNHTLEKMEMELTSIIHQRLQQKQKLLTQKEFDEFVSQTETKLINELHVKINQEIQKVSKVEIRGSDGTHGWPGRKGDPGTPGPKGEAGDRGDNGRKGIKGRKGYIGRPGPKGMNGDRGFKGPNGEKGQKGNQHKGEPGNTGPPGFKGLKGFMGVNGMRGPPGLSAPDGPIGLPGERGRPGLKGVCLCLN